MIEPTLTHYLLALILPLLLVWLPSSANGKLFMAGAVFHMGMQMMFQDIKGMEKYIELVREHWINYSPVVGLLIAVMMGFVFLSVSNDVRKRVDEMFEQANQLAKGYKYHDK